MESFSSRVKQELSEINIWKNSNEIIAELYGYLLTFSDNKIVTENDYNINRFAKILKNLDYNNFSIQISGKNYIIEIKKFKKFKESEGIIQQGIINITKLGCISVEYPFSTRPDTEIMTDFYCWKNGKWKPVNLKQP